MGDNYCDAINNRAFCNYDGGDCCASTVKTKKVGRPVRPLCRRLELTGLGSTLGVGQPLVRAVSAFPYEFHCVLLHCIFHSFTQWWWWFRCSVVSDSCDPMHCSPAGSSVHGILQARVLEWVPFPSPCYSVVELISCAEPCTRCGGSWMIFVDELP